MKIRPAIALLLDALSLDAARLSRERAQALAPAEWRDLVDAAGYQRVSGLLLERLTSRGLAPAAGESMTRRPGLPLAEDRAAPTPVGRRPAGVDELFERFSPDSRPDDS